MNKIAIQGIKGSFHHKVTAECFSSFELNECSTFDKLVKSVIDEDSDYGVMAIENSIAGSILPNYALIDEYNLSITGEYSLSIDHNLMCLSGQSIDDIMEVHSHPMALLQCTKFFTKYPNIRLIESEDTALFAKRISENQINGVGAIASKEAAEIYRLLGMAHLALGQMDQAHYAFIRLLTLDPDYHMPSSENPRFRKAFGDIKAEFEQTG